MTGSLQLAPLLRRYGTFLGFLLIVSFFWSQRPDTFMTTRNWLNITQQVSILCVISFTMTLVMVGGDFDLSVGSMASLSGMIAAVLWQQDAVKNAIGAAPDCNLYALNSCCLRRVVCLCCDSRHTNNF